MEANNTYGDIAISFANLVFELSDMLNNISPTEFSSSNTVEDIETSVINRIDLIFNEHRDKLSKQQRIEGGKALKQLKELFYIIKYINTFDNKILSEIQSSFNRLIKNKRGHEKKSFYFQMKLLNQIFLHVEK